MLVEHSKNSYKFFSCSTNTPRGLSAYKPQKLVVYYLNIQLVFRCVMKMLLIFNVFVKLEIDCTV